MNWIILYEYQVESVKKADFTNTMTLGVCAEPNETWDYIVLPDSEIPLLPLEEEVRYCELLADEESDANYDDLSDEIAWYNHARQMGYE